MNDYLVEIKEISKIFPPSKKAALSNITANIPKGEIVGLVGPDGAGKTTLIRLMAGLLLPTTGSISIAGLDTVKNSTQIHEIIGYMPQKFGLYEDLTVIQNLNLYADLRAVIKEQRVATFKQLLDFTNLQNFQDRLARNLSGGMKQKLGLACALINKPTLLLLDEPSVGVDPISRRELWKMVHQLLDDGISVVWSTAYLDEAEKCDTILLLNEGQLIYNGTAQKITEQMQGRTYLVTNITSNRREILKDLLCQKNVIDGVIQGSDVRFVIKKDSDPEIKINYPVIAVPPRFEDAFIDILGGGPGGISLLAEKIPPVHVKKDLVVEAHNLTKKFGTFTAANNISFNIKAGEIFGLLGPNGAGKSTTFKMLCGLLKPTSGEAFVNGYNLQTAPGQARASIGYMAQKFSLYGNLSVWQNLHFFSGLYNLQGNARDEACKEMIEIFELKEFLNTSADMLPLGFKQRLALACSLMHHPQVLFLDEPTSGVDPITRREFWNHINGLVGKGITVMVTTHFMDEAEYCDRIGLVYQSKLINIGTPDSLKELAKSPTNSTPTLEDAFIHLIKEYDAAN